MKGSSEPDTDLPNDFLKKWTESYSRFLQMACSFTPDAMPPDVLRQIRTGLFEALAKSWEEFLRSPEFLTGMKQMLDNAVAVRQMTGDFFARVRRDTQGVNREDIDKILLAVHEMETRLTRRMNDLAGQGNARSGQPPSTPFVQSSDPDTVRPRKRTDETRMRPRKSAAKQRLSPP